MEPEQTQELMMDSRTRKRGVFGALRSCLRPRPFSPVTLQGVVLGSIIGLSMNEVCVQLILKMSADAGELPAAVNDIFFLSISLLEAILAPVTCWLGYRRRPATLRAWLLLTVLTILPLFFLTFEAPEDLALCTSTPLPRSTVYASPTAILRLAAVTALTVASVLTRLSVWSHGVAILDEHRPETLVKDLGIFITARVIVLSVAKPMLMEYLVTRMWLQVIALLGPLVVKGILLCFVPSRLPDPLGLEKLGGRGFFESLRRVVTNGPAMRHAISLAVLAAGVWGFALHNAELAEQKYHVKLSISQANNFADVFRMFSIILMVLVLSYIYRASVPKEFNKFEASKKTIAMTVAVMVAILVPSLLSCDRTVTGLSAEYNQPSCSRSCGCSVQPNSEFNPVCTLSDMKIYYSPCHAGCRNQTSVNGVTVFLDCECAPSSAVLGPCDPARCRGAYNLHQVMFTVLLIAAVSNFVLHGATALRSVDARDKSIALGVVFSLVALIAFVGGHSLFMGISAWTCAFSTDGRCQLQSPRHGLIIGLTSIGLAAVSLLINIASTVIHKRTLR
ncbi:hypothetical protein JYU34_005426 [Plutella xylostella]|uniref:Kazal-like domain-containing protein n=1 Tax=Plutella xylostella TaxID=51655 RepID=A0ABQ7QWQ0_PLUXY|nr:hypothetical protein JYU34_005426 [Plutella xylostella]